MKRSFLLFSILLLSAALAAQNQGPAVGQWKSYLSYYAGTDCDYSTDYIYTGTQTGFFTYDLNDGVILAYSKVNGMNDIGITNVHYNKLSDKTIIGYHNGNIDIFHNGTFSNIPDFMVSTLPGDKRFYDLASAGYYVYASTTMGLLVIDLERLEISDRTLFYEGSTQAEVLSSAILDDSIFVSTNVGVFKTALGQPFFQDYRSWIKISDESYKKIISTDTRLYVLKDNPVIDSIYRISSTGGLTFHFSSEGAHIGAMDADINDAVFAATEYSPSGSGQVFLIDKDGTASVISTSVYPKTVIRPVSSQIYFADDAESREFGGLRRVTSPSGSENIGPEGPESRFVYDISARNGEIWVAHGAHASHNWRASGSRNYFSSYINNVWENYSHQIKAKGWDRYTDASRIIKDFNTGKVYVGLAFGGLIEMDRERNMTLYANGYLEGAYGDTNHHVVSGLALDPKGQLWIANFASNNELKVKTTDGEFYKFHSSLNPNRFAVDMVIDDHGSKWYYSTSDGGLIVYNDNNTLANPSDDKTNLFRAGRDFGNLPSNTVQCIAKDRNNTIWVGTNNGIGIFNNPKDALEGVGNDTAELRPVKYDDDFDYKRLFTGQSITAIAVDGDNRKWIGTSSNGVFLISSDAQQMLHHFTASNSPLLSDEILRIQIDDITGDVYFGTAFGLIAYRGTSTAPNIRIADELVVYPNPVPSGYEGQITIKGLTTRCEIKITDINGYLITQFETNGGQGVWNGKDYNGRRPQSGVYLVFVTDRTTGKMIKSGKLVFEH